MARYMAITTQSHLHVLVQRLLLLTLLQRKRFVDPNQHHQQTDDTQHAAAGKRNGKGNLLEVRNLFDQSVQQLVGIGEIAAEDRAEETT